MPVTINENVIKRELKQLPEQGNRIVWDEATKGFGICITASGNVSFILNYYFNGRQRRYTIGQYPSEWPIVEDARSEAGKLKLKIRGTDDQAPVDPLEVREQERRQEQQEELNQRTMLDLANSYFEDYAKRHLAPKTQHEFRRMIDAIIAVHLRNVAASEPYKELRQRVIDLHYHLKSTPVEANRVLSLLSAVFNYGIDKEWRTDNPARKIKKHIEEKREKFLTPEQVQQLQKAIDSYHDQDAADVLRLALYTGSRPGEVLRATWTQFDLKQKRWTKPTLATKQRKVHHAPLNREALAVVERRLAARNGSSFLFPGKSIDGKSARTTVKWAWHKICEDAGFGTEYTIPGRGRKRNLRLKRWNRTMEGWEKPLRIYDLRHTFASTAVNEGVPLEVIKELLGHSKIQTTQRYAHLNDELPREAANRVGNIFRRARRKVRAAAAVD